MLKQYYNKYICDNILILQILLFHCAKYYMWKYLNVSNTFNLLYQIILHHIKAMETFVSFVKDTTKKTPVLKELDKID